MFAPVYLDHNASAPLDPRVLEAMLPFLTEQHGNASSRHEYGRVARDAIDRARQAWQPHLAPMPPKWFSPVVAPRPTTS
jgi:cysteine sulfinate desulfinase/cysteine desulfurase-like protein